MIVHPNGLRLVGFILLLGISLLGGLVLPRVSDAGTLYVKPTGGTDSSSCGPQSLPCGHLDYAVNKAVDGDIIKVAGGTHFFRSVAVPCTGVPIKSVLCIVDKAITIIGGYSPSTWNLDLAANPTVIDGQNTYRGIFFISGSPRVRLTLANLTIQNARAKGINGIDPTAFGGGISASDGPVTIDNVTFLNNQAVGDDTTAGQGGTGVGSALSITSPQGGAISYLSNVRFQGNSSVGARGPVQGGFAFSTVFIYQANVHIEDASFISNTVTAGGLTTGGSPNGLGCSGFGGAISIMGGSVASLSRVTATNNQVTGGGGQDGGDAYGGAIYAEDSTVDIRDSVFQSNVARATGTVKGGYAGGGGVIFYHSQGTIERTRIVDNQAIGGNSSPGSTGGNAGGGGLYLWRDNPAVPLAPIQVTNAVIADNLVQPGQGLTPSGAGGGLQVQGLVANLSHVTLARNKLGTGLTAGQAALVVQGGASPNIVLATLNLAHSVVTDHVAATAGSTALVVLVGSTLNLNVGRFSGNTKDINTTGIPAGTITGLATMTSLGTGTGLAGFFSAGSPNFDYHLTSVSPLRGAATGSTVPVDMDYQLRADGARDLGADEYVAATCTPGGAFDTDGDGIPDAVEQIEGTHACAKDNDVFLSPRLLVMQQYRDFLGREYDIDGYASFMAQMGTGTTAEEVVKTFADSKEFYNLVAPIVRLYLAYFRRIPDLPGLQSWTAQFKAGTPLAIISNSFANSSEFLNTYGPLTNAQFVTLVYRNLLGRDPDPGGFSSWLGQLDSGAITRGQMVLQFSKSPEFKQASANETFVIIMYYAMLRRMPKQAPYAGWVADLDAGTSPLTLIGALLDLPEYSARFLP